MKRFLCLFLAFVMFLSFAACSKGGIQTSDFFSKPEDITTDVLLERTRVLTMLGYRGSFRADYRDEDTINGGLNPVSTNMRFAYDGSNILANNMADYDNGTYRHQFFSTAHDDSKLYIDSSNGPQIAEMSDRELQNILDQSLFSLEMYETVIDECKKHGDSFTVRFSCALAGQLVQIVTANIEAESGMVRDAVIEHYSGDVQTGTLTLTMTYGDVVIDRSPMEKALANAANTAPEEKDEDTQSTTAPKTGPFTFATTDVDGNPVTYNDFAYAKQIMVHYWEPSNEACVSKLPDLQKLYDAHKIEDFVILGVFSTEGADEEVKAIVEEAGITFPILHLDSRLKTWQTDRIPTTIFVNENGEVITDEPYFGALSYDDWETVLSEQLVEEAQETQ